ncbi:MAG: hypothetical protein V4724_02400 [Pseudomonadota bacterium]
MSGYKTLVRYALFSLALTLAAPGRAAPEPPIVVRYPQAQNEVDRAYFIEMLKLALSKAPARYRLQEWRMRMEKSRALHELASGGKLDVAWAVTNRAREAQLLPVRIPLDKGLFGWRIALIRQRDSAIFQNIEQVDALARQRAGLGFDWAETAILRANGLPVVTGTTSDGLYQMLAANRFDYMPRSIAQIWEEAEQHAGLGIVAEPALALHFPSAVYFFVNRRNAALAAALEQGLLAALDDGSFDRLFHAYNADSIQRANLGRRKIFELTNPDMSAQTPLHQARFWFSPTRDDK